MSDEWGPWIEHDGREDAVPGHLFVAVQFYGQVFGPIGNPDGDFARVWWWGRVGHPADIIRYRVRTPRAMELLRRIAALTDKVNA